MTWKYRHADSHGNLEERAETDIPLIVNETIIPKLQQLGLEKDYNAESLQIHNGRTNSFPYNYRRISISRRWRSFWRTTSDCLAWSRCRPVRFFSHTVRCGADLGYVGAPHDIDKMQRDEADNGKTYNFYQPDMEGMAQIEKTMDHFLRGEPGVRILRTDAKNQILEESEQLVQPQRGADVYLTIDVRLQYVVEDTLRVAGRAACVVVDVNNGDILAMASVPSYDPNKFVPSVDLKEWRLSSRIRHRHSRTAPSAALSLAPPSRP